MSDGEIDRNWKDRIGHSQARMIVITIVVLVVVLGGLFAWRSWRMGGDAGAQRPPVAVAGVAVVARDVPVALEAVGTLTAVREVTLSPEVAGRVTAIRFAAGSDVGQGALLVQLFDGPERADRQAAVARSRFAGLQVSRSRQLLPSGAEPREVLQQREAERDQALASIQQLDARLVQKQVRAPFAGRLGIRRVNIGQYLNPGDPVATLTALDQLYVEFAVPQQQFSRIVKGTTVSVAADAFPGRTFTAKVNAVEPRIDEDTRNITVQALLPNPDRALRPGMYVTAALDLPSQAGALVVPATAIQTSAQGDSMIVIRGANPRKSGKAEVVPVTVSSRVGDDVVISGAIKAGDIVVAEGQLRVQPGANVNVTRMRGAGLR